MMLPAEVTIREVGPRDGLQVEAPLPTGDRIALIEGLAACGLTAIEAVAFVSPDRVPAMADAAAVMGGLARTPGVVYFGLVPNLRGAQLALDAGVDAMTVTVSASDHYSHQNVGRSREEAAREVDRILAFADAAVLVDVVVSCAFGYGGHEPADLGWIVTEARRWADAGPCSLTLADTTGEAGPDLIEEAVQFLGPHFGLHLHETRGTGLVNAYAALLAGIARFDTSVAGLGGSPFADGSGGNLATEDLVHLLGLLGVPSGVDLERLLDRSRAVTARFGRAESGRLARSGPAQVFAARP